MTFNKTLAFVVTGIISGHVSLAEAQQIRSATWSTDQFLLRYRTMVEPPRTSGHSVNIGGGGADDSKTNHRILTDSQQKKYFGYDLEVQPVSNGRFQLTFKPLTLSALNRKFFNLGPEWSEVPLPSVPTAMQVNEGETVALDLMVNPAAGEKIVEYITVSSGSKNKSAAAIGGNPRDIQASDIQMSLMSPKMHINGNGIEWNRGDAHGTAAGSVVWLYVPDKGRFLLSSQPHAGFRQAGEARGATVKFTWNGDTYELTTDGNVLPGDSAFNIYVYQDAGYRPDGYPPAPYGAGATPEQLLRR